MPKHLLTFLILIPAIAFSVVATESVAQSLKRGTAGNSALRANALNTRWNYRWHYLEPDGIYNDSQWTPMLFGVGSDQNLNNRIDYLLDRQNQFDHVLGFNEPERSDQGNVSVTRAVEAWEIIDNRLGGSTGLKLVSPAVSDNTEGQAWLADFMQQADAGGLQVDAVAFHWYGNVNPANPIASANAFLQRVDDYHATYQRPVWITEFAGHDWNDQYSDPVMQQANAEFLAHAIPGLESRDHVERYSWFQTSPESSTPREEGLLTIADSHGLLRPTLAGKAYMPDQVLLAGESLDLNGQSKGRDYYYLQGGSISNSGTPLADDSVGGLYVMANEDGSLRASTLSGSSDWGLTTGAFVRIEDNSTLRKTGTNTVTWNEAQLYIDGQVRLFGGTGNEGSLRIENVTSTAGDGFFRLDQGSHLQLGRTGDSLGFALPYDMQLRGGRISTQGTVGLSGDNTLFSYTSIDVAGIADNLIVSGNFMANAAGSDAGIVKSGLGQLVLSGQNSIVGNIRAQAGTLSIDGTTEANLVRIDLGASLQGVGNIEADVLVSGQLSPGNSIGTLTADSISLLDGSTLTMEIGAESSFDQLIVDGELLVESGALLQIILTDTFQPSVGDEFQLLAFGSFTGNFVLIDAPPLTFGRWDSSRLNSDGVMQFVAVPEPQHFIFLLSLAAPLALVRRKAPRLHPAYQ